MKVADSCCDCMTNVKKNRSFLKVQSIGRAWPTGISSVAFGLAFSKCALCSFRDAHPLKELCFWTLSIVWCLKNKQNWGIKNYRHSTWVFLASSVLGCVWVCVCLGLYAILVFLRFFMCCEVCSGWITYCHLCLTGFKGLCVCAPR
jgi:hypothetical protein